MGIKRHKPEEIVTKLRQVEMLCGQGMPRVCYEAIGGRAVHARPPKRSFEGASYRSIW